MAEQMKEHGKKVCRKHEKSGVFFIQHEKHFLLYWIARHIGGKVICFGCNCYENGWNVSLLYCCW